MPRDTMLLLTALMFGSLPAWQSGCRRVEPGPKRPSEPRDPPVAPPPEPSARPEPRYRPHPTVALELVPPEGWQQQVKGPLLSLLAPADEMLVLLLGVETTRLEPVMNELDRQLAAVVEQSSLTALTEGEVGGLQAYFARGRGQMDRAPIHIEVVLVRTPRDKVLIVLALEQEGASAQVREEFEAMLASMRPQQATP